MRLAAPAVSEVAGTLADVTDNAHPHPHPSSADADAATPGAAAAVPDSSALRLFTVEVGAWLSILAAAALAFGAAGTFGVSAFIEPADLQDIHAATVADSFAARPAVLLYAAVLAAGVAGVFVPRGRLGGATALRVALVAAGLQVALAVLTVFIVSALVPVAMGLCVGAVFAAILSMVRTSRAKPWRSAGVASGITLVVTYAAQLLGGADGGHVVMPWLALLGGIILLLGLLLMLRSQPQGDIRLPDTGAHPVDRAAIARPASPVSSAWPCHLLFAVLGAVGILAQPSVAELGFGQGGMSLIICAVLLGWAVGFETGPHFAPGMTRTRLTTFALLTAGVLTIGTGLLAELSGRAVLSGGVAFLVGLGVRAQRYSFSRRIGALAGMGGAVVVTALGVSGEVPLSEHVAWAIRPADVSYVLVGLVAVVGGIVALFTFGPTGIRGLGVDVVHAFRLPQTSRPTGGQQPAEVQHQESEAAEVPTADAGDRAEAAHAAAGRDHADQEDLAVLSAGQSPHPAATPVGLDAGRGFFIALEGGDGTGKSTQIHLLAEALRDRGAREVVTTREPGGTEAGTKLRSVVLDGDGVTTRAEALVFAADRAHHVASLVRPVLERGGIVITDRYIDSSRAYQAAGRDLGDEEITALSRWATEGLQPDLTIVLDANPAVTRQRTGGRGDQNHLDMLDLQFHTAVRQAFLDFAHAAPHKYAVVDAGRDIDTVASRVLEVVDERMRNRALPDDGSEDETRVVRRVPAAQEQEQAQASGDGQAPAQDQVPEPDEMPEPSEMPTQVHVRAQEPAHPADASAQSAGAPAHSAGAEVDPSEAPTTVHPVTPPPPPVTQPAPATAEARQTSRERLRAQAEIERRARERLRAQRDGGSGDFGPGGAGSR